MSIKNEKLQELVSGILSDPNSQVAQRADYVVADMLLPVLIERVETRCRERAVRAHAKECHYRIGDRDTCRLSDFHTPCDAILQCNWKQNFLKHYDNDR